MAPERGQEVDIALWYPATAGGTPVLFGDSAIFSGVPAQQDAPLWPAARIRSFSCHMAACGLP
ncbi:MAG: hypothetical protein R3C69_03345 [Geminicoccaceae bacterium]